MVNQIFETIGLNHPKIRTRLPCHVNKRLLKRNTEFPNLTHFLSFDKTSRKISPYSQYITPPLTYDSINCLRYYMRWPLRGLPNFTLSRNYRSVHRPT